MTRQNRLALVAAIGLPIITITVYLRWVWPRPHGTSVMAQTGPYVLSLLTGLPFAWSLTRRSGRLPLMLTFLVAGFALLWLYALVVLCALRDVCL